MEGQVLLQRVCFRRVVCLVELGLHGQKREPLPQQGLQLSTEVGSAPFFLVPDVGGVAQQMRQAFLLPEACQFFGIIALAAVADQNTLYSRPELIP